MKRAIALVTLSMLLFAARAQESEEETITVKDVSFTMVLVQGGTYTMGATSEQGEEASEDEKPAHKVVLGDFYIGTTEVTQELWKAVMESNPSYFKGDALPVEQVSWFMALEFAQRLSELTGKTFRLPTEAEWEYAARGGHKATATKYSGGNKVSDLAWSKENSGAKTHPVKGKTPNELGLYDMSGNVWEWCGDAFYRYTAAEAQNPTKEYKDGGIVVRRGGCYAFSAPYHRVSTRSRIDPTRKSSQNGLRIVMEP